jgi:hypothetical protein
MLITAASLLLHSTPCVKSHSPNYSQSHRDASNHELSATTDMRTDRSGNSRDEGRLASAVFA